MDVIKKFLASDRPGIYFRVLEEGEVGDEDSIVLINRDRDLVTVSDIVRLYINDTADIKTMGCAVKVDALPDGWKCHFLEQIERVEKHESKIK